MLSLIKRAQRETSQAHRRGYARWFFNPDSAEAKNEIYEDVLMRMTKGGSCKSLLDYERQWTEHAIKQSSQWNGDPSISGNWTRDDLEYQLRTIHQIGTSAKSVTPPAVAPIEMERDLFSEEEIKLLESRSKENSVKLLALIDKSREWVFEFNSSDADPRFGRHRIKRAVGF